MKQHISVEQVNEIEKWESILIDLELFEIKHIKEGVTDREIAEVITIGKILEILNNKDFNIELEILCFSKVKISRCDLDKPLVYEEKELCDALWECIKDILKEVK